MKNDTFLVGVGLTRKLTHFLILSLLSSHVDRHCHIQNEASEIDTVLGAHAHRARALPLKSRMAKNNQHGGY